MTRGEKQKQSMLNTWYNTKVDLFRHGLSTDTSTIAFIDTQIARVQNIAVLDDGTICPSWLAQNVWLINDPLPKQLITIKKSA